MRIGIDIDGVVVDILDECVKFLKECFIITERDKITKYNLWEQFPVSKEETMKHWKNVTAYDRCKFMKDAIYAIDLLSLSNNEIYFVTARPNEVARYTVNWLRDIKIPYNNVLFTTDKELIVRNYGIKVFIDDNADTCNKLADVCRRTYVFDAPYNRVPMNPKVKRVSSWADFMVKFKQEFGLSNGK